MCYGVFVAYDAVSWNDTMGLSSGSIVFAVLAVCRRRGDPTGT